MKASIQKERGMIMKVKKFSKKGRYNEENNQENQDYLCSIETDKYIGIVLADGASSCKRARDGARYVCEVLTQVIHQEPRLFWEFSKEKIAFLIIQQILYYLERKKELQIAIQEYGSMFCMAIMEKKNGRMILMSLGDNDIISIKQNGFRELVEIGKYKEKMCLTTTHGAELAMDIMEYKLALGERIFLCSNGFRFLLTDNEVVQLLNENDIEGLKHYLSQMVSEDDCSFITFIRERD